MALATVNGIRLSYQETGSGDLVLLVMGTGSPGRVWHLYQVPALVEAGYRVATFENRGIPPSDECAEGFTIDDMVADTAELIRHLGGGPARVIGASLGARIVQELALAHPDLVTRAIFVAGHGRPSPAENELSRGERELHDAGIELPPTYYAAITAMLNLSPRTMREPSALREWLDIFSFSGASVGPGVRAQLDVEDFSSRLTAYRGITVPSLVIGFADDMMVPPYLCREVAEEIPDARYEEVSGCGHYGYLERPDEVNELILKFLAST